MRLHFKSAVRRLLGRNQVADRRPPGELDWQCNLCGALNRSLAANMQRETGECATCGTLMRYRSVAATLTQRLYGDIRILAQLDENKSIKGLGMSDNDSYATLLAGKFSYINTFYHCEPRLDILQPEPAWLGVYDFVISSDVFEHVAPPVQPAFDNLHALLRPGGVLIFSVPFLLEGETIEHFPRLHHYSIVQDGDNEWVLNNETADGTQEQFRNLVFHGGEGLTLEMRLFTLPSLQQHLLTAGFTDVQVHGEAYFEHGIFWVDPRSVIISARKALPA